MRLKLLAVTTALLSVGLVSQFSANANAAATPDQYAAAAQTCQASSKSPLISSTVDQNCIKAALAALENSSEGVVTSTATKSETARNKSVAEYWTPERMRNAQPLEVNSELASTRKRQDNPGSHRNPLTTVASEPIDSLQPSVEHATTGKLFFTTQGFDTSCSGSVVNSPGKNSVWTAGHCLYVVGDSWNTNVAFAPGFNNGEAPHGLWEAEQLSALQAFANDGRVSQDVGVVTVETINGQHIVDAVGGAGLVLYPPTKTGVTVFGYPASRADDITIGQDDNIRQRCQATSFLEETRAVGSLCPTMGNGASGGPWLTDRGDEATYLAGVTSRFRVDGTGIIFSPYFGDAAAVLDAATRNR